MGTTSTLPDQIRQVISSLNLAVENQATENASLATAIASAQTSADGKTTNYYGPDEPAMGALQIGDTWFDTAHDFRISRWDGSTWIAAQFGNAALAAIDAAKITTGTLDAARLAAHSITTGLLAADAIDGMTITGTIIRTAASGARIQLDSVNGIRGFDASNVVKTQITTGGVLTAVDATITGTVRTGPVSGLRWELSPIPGDDGRLDINMMNAAVTGPAIQGGMRATMNFLNIFGGVQHKDSNRIWLSPSPNAPGGVYGDISLFPGAVGIGSSGTLQLTGSIDFTTTATKRTARTSLGMYDDDTYDTGWVTVTPAVGYTGAAYVRRIDSTVYMRNLITVPASVAANTTYTCCTLPTGYRPASGSNGIPSIFTNGEIAWGSVASTGVWSFRKPTAGTGVLMSAGSWPVN
ncbi:hypothetical protein GCM10010401_14300 [Rarobacter faecitabidus]|uniref:Uncharacterized protein n=1 Tax=Rarobacter faecitabidus TaxID=13243 RepID=A0A542ZDU6_RARFA|nr:hypothetical protein [Rarobacter faecitabidus]TQL58523.1 hypothetical protein FB461_1938 [Rarobacter faecitabidus]